MLPPCFALSDRVFPSVRQRAARLLAAADVTQAEIGRRLGVSQAMVSKYLKGELIEPAPEEAWIVDEMARQVAEDDLMGPGAPEPGQANPWCRTFAQTLGPGSDARRAVVTELARVLQGLARAPLAPLVPNVSVNVAGALADAAERADIAAFPGRLALVRGQLRAHGPPEFGASRHLAELLLRARRDRPELRLVLNLRGGDAVARALRRAGEPFATAAGDGRDELGVPEFRLGKASALVDPGGFGIEPAVYLFDADPEALAQRVARLSEALPQPKRHA